MLPQSKQNFKLMTAKMASIRAGNLSPLSFDLPNGMLARPKNAKTRSPFEPLVSLLDVLYASTSQRIEGLWGPSDQAI